MKRTGFTLIELLVVVAIMGLLGTIAVGGYRQMQRGMEERGVMENVHQFMVNAYERAQLDRQPVWVYLWNETLKIADDYETGIVVGRALAVRPAGRVTAIEKVTLLDEFGDLEQFDEDGQYAKAASEYSQKRLYQLDGTGNTRRYSLVRDIPQTPNGDGSSDEDLAFATYDPAQDSDDARLIRYGYKRETDVNVNWKVGSVYGFEFAELELPHGYIFDQSIATDLDDPVREIGTVRYSPNDSSMPTAGKTVYRCVLEGSGGTTTKVGSF